MLKGGLYHMMKRYFSIAIVAALVLIGLGCARSTNTNGTANTAARDSADAVENAALNDNTNEAVTPEDSSILDTSAATDTNTVIDTSGNTNDTTNADATSTDAPAQTGSNVTGKSAKYTEYTDKALADAVVYGRPVLFFYASWDQTSKDAEVDILANLGALPEGVTVLKVNYDSADSLKKQYGITYQHSFVQIDAHGNKVISWSGADAASIIDNLRT